jgi:toxin FitB
MILLDTNVISEPLRPVPDVHVISWLRKIPTNICFLSTISMAELLRGIQQLPDGKRRAQMADDAEATFSRLFAGRILAFDQRSARAYAQLCADMKSRGKAIDPLDAQIAAIATVNRMTVATRDTSPFHHAGLEVINPWNDDLQPQK